MRYTVAATSERICWDTASDEGEFDTYHESCIHRNQPEWTRAPVFDFHVEEPEPTWRCFGCGNTFGSIVKLDSNPPSIEHFI